MEEKIIKKRDFQIEVEKKMAEIRLLHALKKINIIDILKDGDKAFGNYFTPF